MNVNNSGMRVDLQ